MRFPSIWTLIFFAALVVAAAYRLPRLGERPMHTDEAVQAVKFGYLLEEGHYRYDPKEYHGPTLYYLTLPAARLAGVKDLASLSEPLLRAVPVAFGLALLLLLPLLRDAIGRGGVALAALLTALSPIQVYYSRYYIQESLLVFFTLALAVCAWRYFRDRRLGWMLAAGVSAGLLHATKETCIIVGAALAGAAVVSTLLYRLTGPERTEQKAEAPAFRWWHLGVGLAAAAFVSALFYSSFFTHPAGIWDSFRSYFMFTDRAQGQGHEKPWWYYLHLLGGHRNGGFTWSEILLLVPAVIGAVFALRWKKDGEPFPWVGIFLTAYLLLLFAAYSVIPYKTPWLMMGFMQGVAVLGGYGIWRTLRSPALALLGLALLLAAVVDLGGQSLRGNFRFAADERNPYAYSHTSADCLRLAERMRDLARHHEQGFSMPIYVMSKEYWPLPWYLRAFDRDRVGYWNDPVDLPPVPVVITDTDRAEAMGQQLGENYVPDLFGLRPGFMMQVFIEKPLWDAFMARE